MASRKFLVLIALLLTSAIGCAPAKDQSNFSNKVGNSLRDAGDGSAGTSSTVLGAITSPSGDQAFNNELYLLTYPMFNGTNQKLGFVSAGSSQSTGVRFWGVAGSSSQRFNASYMNLDSSTLRIHMDIYDANGVVTHIGISKSSSTFKGASGTVQNGRAQLYWQDGYGTIALSGTVNNQTFQGTVYYQDSATNNSWRGLGNFSVSTCGFFVCH